MECMSIFSAEFDSDCILIFVVKQTDAACCVNLGKIWIDPTKFLIPDAVVQLDFNASSNFIYYIGIIRFKFVLSVFCSLVNSRNSFSELSH